MKCLKIVTADYATVYIRFRRYLNDNLRILMPILSATKKTFYKEQKSKPIEITHYMIASKSKDWCKWCRGLQIRHLDRITACAEIQTAFEQVKVNISKEDRNHYRPKYKKMV